MINKIVGWLVLVPLCAVLVLFALANRHLVALNFNPFVPVPAELAPGYGVPLFVVLYLVLLAGVLAGGMATWFAQGGHRRREKHWRRETQHLSHELDRMRRQNADARPANDVDDLLELR
jgi:hypothetical protein